MLVLWHPHILSMVFYRELLTSESLLENMPEDEFHCFHDGKEDHMVAAWCLECRKTDSKKAVGLALARIGAQGVEGGLKTSCARTVDVSENIVLMGVVGNSFAVAGMALGWDERELGLGCSYFSHRDSRIYAVQKSDSEA